LPRPPFRDPDKRSLGVESTRSRSQALYGAGRFVEKIEARWRIEQTMEAISPTQEFVLHNVTRLFKKRFEQHARGGLT
jgi:hypothetical protein